MTAMKSLQRAGNARAPKHKTAAAAPGGVTLLFDETEIAARVAALAREVDDELPEDFTIVGVLKGCFVFVADLARGLDRLGRRPRIEFMQLSSYGLGRESSRRVRLLGDIPVDITGRTILLVDDIVDTGYSLAYARDLLVEAGAVRVWTCALLDKPSRRAVDIVPDFIGFTIEDVFVVGYGIDFAEDCRHLPFIGKVD